MSFGCRYHLHPDGTFARLGNMDGCIDDFAEEQLARLCLCSRRGEADRRPRDCSRCGRGLLLHSTGFAGTAVLMELCEACDADHPAAAAFIRWYHGPAHDPKALDRLAEDWAEETMSAAGWSRVAPPEAPDGPLLPPGLTPRGRG